MDPFELLKTLRTIGPKKVLRALEAVPIPDSRKLELYPPFLFMGAKVVFVSGDYRKMHIQLPLRWYARNHFGTMFGGFIASLADPLPALLCGRYFEREFGMGTVHVATKKLGIHFLRPGRSTLEARVELPEEQLAVVREELYRRGFASPKFTFYFFDEGGKKVAKVHNTVAIRVKQPGSGDRPRGSHG